MNWLDITLLVIIASAVFFGLKTGLIKAVFSLAGIIVGVILAGRLHTPLAGQLTFIPQPGIAEVVAFAIILIGTMIVASILARLVKWTASIVMLGWVNYLGGAAFGFVMGSLFCGALLASWVKYFGAAEIISQSSLANILLDRFPAVLALLPEEFDAIRSFFE
ncbi:MAG: CvpA family protein [Dehalococcoidales bacterium]|nr:CvpA family protein [Dehalococcoidales bacterium]